MQVDFLILHRKDTGKKLALNIEAVSGFAESEEDDGSIVYFENTSAKVQESYDLICTKMKGMVQTNIPWVDRKPQGFWSYKETTTTTYK